MEFRRFVSYIYSYEGKEKDRNCGFVKVEYRQNTVRFVVHMHLPKKRAMEYKVYGFVREGENLKGVLLAVGASKNGTMDVRFRVNPERVSSEEEDLDNPVMMEQLAGVYIIAADQCVYATVWDEEDVDVTRFQLRKREEAPEISAQEVVCDSENQDASQCETCTPSRSGCGTDEQSQSRRGTNPQPPCRWDEMDWESLENQCSYVAPFEYMPEQVFLKIEPRHLRYFPQRLWYLGKNGFMLHGYYQHHYLVVGKWDETVVLGVPGIYSPMEERMAAVFGFTQFHPMNKRPKELGAYGIWCRELYTPRR